jgi:hypothetical protein
MQRLKCLFAAAAVAGPSVIATTNFVEAQAYLVTAPDCVPPPPWRWYKNWLRADIAPDLGAVLPSSCVSIRACLDLLGDGYAASDLFKILVPAFTPVTKSHGDAFKC